MKTRPLCLERDGHVASRPGEGEVGVVAVLTVNAESTNELLLRRCRAGDGRAWEVLVTRFERLIQSVALREGLSKDDAGEITQRTFVSLFESLHAIRKPESLSYWLMTAARREVWKVKKNRSSAEVDLVITESDWSERQAEISWVHDVLHSLGEPCRSLLFNLYFDPDEPSYAEVAVALGRPVGSVGPLRSRCLERARKVMELEFDELTR